jgi:thioredoxin reductase
MRRVRGNSLTCINLDDYLCISQPLKGLLPVIEIPGNPHGLPVVVVGAGPVGLAAAAHLLERELDALVLEAGGEVASAVASWGHVRVFSPWRYNVDQAAERLLAPTGWTLPDPDGYPTGAELRRDYLVPLAATAELRDRIRTGARVIAITRLGRDKMRNEGRDRAPFELAVETGVGTERIPARAVIDTSGALETPNPLGASGIPAAGERELAAAIDYGLPDVLAHRARYDGKRVLVVGSGHSAMNVLDDLVTLRRRDEATEIVWAVRRGTTDDLYGGGTGDGLPERARLGATVERLVGDGAIRLVTAVEIEALERTSGGILVRHRKGELGPFDRIVAATGFRPDLEPLRELRLALDSAVEAPAAIAPLIDPNFHSCGSVPPHGVLELAHPESDFYIAGLKSYGRAPTFLMLTGYEQVRSIAAALAGDLEAASRVELVLPETGVCKVSLNPPNGAADIACCGGDAPAIVGAPPAVANATLHVIANGGCCTATASEDTAPSTSCCG